MSRLLLGVDVAPLRRWGDEFAVALRAHDFCGAGETHTQLEPRHPPLRSVALCRGSLDSTLWNDGVKCRLGRWIEHPGPSATRISGGPGPARPSNLCPRQVFEF